VRNPSFEDGGGSFQDWIIEPVGTGFAVEVNAPGADDNMNPTGGTAHSATFSVSSATTVGRGWIAQRMIVCPNTTYVPDFYFQWSSTQTTPFMVEVSGSCSLQFSWGNYPGDFTSGTPMGATFASVSGSSAYTGNFNHITYGSPVITMSSTAANQTSAYLQVAVDCTSLTDLVNAAPAAFIDTMQIYVAGS
jgi:hypothetical protein